MNVHRAYRVLGLAPTASPAEVRQAYRDLAQVWHPDRFAHSERLQQKAQRNLKRINEAFEVLKDREPDESAPRDSLLSSTFSAIQDLGDIMQTAVSVRHRPKPRAGPQVLGLGDLERTGVHASRRRRSRRSRRRRGRVMLAALAFVIAVGAALFMLLEF